MMINDEIWFLKLGKACLKSKHLKSGKKKEIRGETKMLEPLMAMI